METTRTCSASYRIASANTPCGDVDAGIAATRRIQHLTVVARDNINEPESLDQDALAKAVVKALYTEHPHIRLEDALELARIVDRPPKYQQRTLSSTSSRTPAPTLIGGTDARLTHVQNRNESR